MADRPHRVAVVLTHPVQYFSPWFRFIHEHAADIDLRVLYAVSPTPEAQGTGFGTAFAWDQPLLAGYPHQVLHDGASAVALGADRFSDLDARHLEDALLADRPDVVLVPGWHAAVYRRAMRICRQHRIPALYRGDSNLRSGPTAWLARAAWRRRTRSRLREYAAFLSVGTRSREYLRTFGAPEPLIFDSPHAVDNAFFAQPPTMARAALALKWGLDPERFTVLFAGKLETKKRPLDLVRAVEGLPGVQLLVVGAGPLERECREEAARRGVAAAFPGFVNQAGLADVFGTADCLALPSDGRETWGLVVNEALAAGVPAVVSDRVGCQPDLVVEGETGAVFTAEDVGSLRRAMERVRGRVAEGHNFRAACQARAERHSFAAATDGLRAACARLAYRAQSEDAQNPRASTRVVAFCGHMVTPGGLERMTFEVLAALRRENANVHCLVNQWDSSRIVALAEGAGVTWSIGRSDESLRRVASPAAAARMAVDITRASLDVLNARVRHRATHILLPDFLVAVRAWPALALLRLTGSRVILRVGMAPPVGRFYAGLWKWVVNAVVDRMICNSEFLVREVRERGVPDRKLGLIRNTAVPRSAVTSAPRDPGRVVYVGQVIPDKGVDVLMAAVGQLREEGRAVTLDIVGDMDGWESPTYAGYRDRLRTQADQPSLRGGVRFLGYRDDVGAILSSAAVHCCPSRLAIREGMANVVLEAKAAAVPSVVTRSGSLPELVEDGVDGWVVDDTVAAVAAGVRGVLDDPEFRGRAGEAARRSLERYGREPFEAAWLAEFDMTPAPHLWQARRTTA